jgi:S1-C subfamily serine protease
MKKLLTSLVLFVALTSNLVFSQSETKSFPSDQAVSYAKQNQVVLTCRGEGDEGHFVAGGQGEIIQVDQTGVWILTARHVSFHAESCDAMFPDYSFHTAYLSKQFEKSDLAILFVPKAYWPTHASIAAAKLNSDLFVFTEIKRKFTLSGDTVLGFFFDFDYTVHSGTAYSYAPAELLSKIGYPVPPGSVILTDLYSRPGSSGGGVYDKEGNLVGVVSCGNTQVTMIVDIAKALEEESL